MKNYLFYFIAICSLYSCTSSAPPDTKKEQLVQDNQNTSTALSKIPSIYAGIIGCSNCDSLSITLDLKSNGQQFLLTKKYMSLGISKKDSVSYNSGKWSILGANELNLIAEVPDPEFSKFKIEAPDQILLLDSTGSEKTNGKNYRLMQLKDSVAIN